MKITISKNFLHQKYEIERLTQQEIADIVGCSGATVLRRMRDHGIVCRSKSEITRFQWIIGVYKNNAERLRSQHANGSRIGIYKKISDGLIRYFSNPENRDAIKGKNSAGWKGGKIKRTCEVCGNTFEVYPCLVKMGWGRYCSPKCQAQWQSEEFSGEDSPNWRGGDKEYPETFNGEFKKMVRARDRFTCRLCGKKEENRAHDVHHINYIKNDTTLENCITLCLVCHRKTNSNRKYWEEVLSNLQIREEKQE